MRAAGPGSPPFGGSSGFPMEQQALMPAGPAMPAFSHSYHERLDYLQAELEKLKIVEMERRRYQMQMVSPGPSAGYSMSSFPMPGASMGGFEQVTSGYRALMDAYNTLAKAHTDLLKEHAELMTKKASDEAAATTKPSPPPSVPKVNTAAAAPAAGDATASARAPMTWRNYDTKPMISNSRCGPMPTEPSLLDNTLLFLPEAAVKELGLEPNMDDKGDACKELWFGRVWELRSLLGVQYEERLKKMKLMADKLSPERKAQLDKLMADPVMKARLIKLQGRWKGAAARRRNSFDVLERLKFAYLRSYLVYAHGSGGCSWDNMRICRMISRIGVLVIAPDGFAYPKNTAMGQMRHKEIQPIKLATDNVDYWEGDLIYKGDATGSHTYSTKADNVLHSPDEHRKLYEKCYQLRRSELHFVINRLPQFIKTQGFFLGGTSEGGMTIARFDDQRYGEMVCGRFVNSFSIEYNYFTPTPEAGEIGGQVDVPTLNIIGTKDQYFGPTDSVSKIVVEDAVAGYGDKELRGHGFKTMVRQGIDAGLVCVLEEGVHSPCDTHDNFLRLLFDHFFTRPGSIWELDAIWGTDPVLRDMMEVRESSVQHVEDVSNVVHCFVPLPKFPNKWPLRKVQTSMEFSRFMKENSELREAMESEKKELAKKHEENKQMLDQVRLTASKKGGWKVAQPKATLYDNDKLAKVNKVRVKSAPSGGLMASMTRPFTGQSKG